MTDLVFLPATDPRNATYGQPPARVDGWPDAHVHTLRFDTEVWYNRAVRPHDVRPA